MRSLLAVLMVLGAAPVFAAPWDLSPPPRGQWALDQTGKVSAGTLAQLDSLAASLDAAGAGQLGVLVINSTSGVNPRDFATGVFNSWGVGNAGADDGILLFIAVSDRKAEIILGDGSKVSRSITDAVMRDDVVANMKRGNLDQALLAAARSLDGHMRRVAGKAPPLHVADNHGLGPDAYVTPTRATPQSDDVLAPFADGQKSFPERSPRSWVVDVNDVLTASQRAQLDVAASDVYVENEGRVFFLVVKSAGEYPSLDQLVKRFVGQVRPLSKLPSAVVALDLSGAAAIHLPEGTVTDAWEYQQVERAQNALRDAAMVDRVAAMLEAQRFARQAITHGIPPRPMGDALAMGFERYKTELTGAGGVGLVLGLLGLKRWNRRRIRTCEECNQPRELLSDQVEDEHLGAAQLKEESIGSVDYDVWFCGRCNDALVLRYGAFFTAYSSCPQCNAKTKRSNTTTLRHATEYQGGLQQIDEHCEHCSYRNSYTRTTARITRSSSSSSSSWSSSSSGSSFGGGSSSGGGSSGSW